MQNLDFSTKELIDSFVYSNAKEDRRATTCFRHNGRIYEKFGTLQIVTVVANIYKVHDTEQNKSVNVMLAGIAKQSTYEKEHNKQMAESLAAERAQSNPAIVMIVPECYTKRWFEIFMYDYVHHMNLKFMKTAAEIKAGNVDDRNNIKFDFE